MTDVCHGYVMLKSEVKWTVFTSVQCSRCSFVLKISQTTGCFHYSHTNPPPHAMQFQNHLEMKQASNVSNTCMYPTAAISCVASLCVVSIACNIPMHAVNVCELWEKVLLDVSVSHVP